MTLTTSSSWFWGLLELQTYSGLIKSDLDYINNNCSSHHCIHDDLFLVRSLGFERRENDYLKGEMEIEQQRKEIAARSPSDADSLLGRMRSEDNK